MTTESEGQIAGKPTLLAIFAGRLDTQLILNALGSLGDPHEDVSLYYRIQGTDQVIDARTGHMAAGQSITQDELTPKMAENVETVILMHPDASRYPAVRQALAALGEMNVLYSGEPGVEAAPGDAERRDGKVT